MRLFKSKAKKPQISKEEALRCIPVKHPAVNQQQTESGGLLLHYPATDRARFAGVLGRWSKSSQVRIKKLQLDELGTGVWQLIDGSRSVRGIVNRFCRVHRLQYREAEMSVTVFLRELGKRELIAMRQPEAPRK